MFTVGLTGGIGSGKTLVANRFAEHDVTVIDSDRIAHQLTAPGGAAMLLIEKQFGAQFITADGALDRIKMRTLIFEDAQAKAQLEAILHPMIRAECDRAAARAALRRERNHVYNKARVQTLPTYLVFVVPLLIESGNWKNRVDRILVVDCSEATQVERVIQRNGFSQQQVEAIIAQQTSRLARLACADDVIHNDQAPIAQVLEEVDKLHAYYLRCAKMHT